MNRVATATKQTAPPRSGAAGVTGRGGSITSSNPVDAGATPRQLQANSTQPVKPPFVAHNAGVVKAPVPAEIREFLRRRRLTVVVKSAPAWYAD